MMMMLDDDDDDDDDDDMKGNRGKIRQRILV
jgi:hypothetical protein